MNALHQKFWYAINTTAYHLGLYCCSSPYTKGRSRCCQSNNGLLETREHQNFVNLFLFGLQSLKLNILIQTNESIKYHLSTVNVSNKY